MFEGFDQAFIKDVVNRRAENAVDRRRFLRAAGLGVAGVGALGVTAGTAFAGHETQGAVTPPWT